MTVKRIAVIGSRGFASLDRVRDFVRSLPPGTMVVSGGARGVDSAAETAAREAGVATEIHHADWDTHGRKAGPMRNALIIANADAVVAFWDGESRGTLNALVQAHEAGLPITIHDEQGQEVSLADAMSAADATGVTASIERARDRELPKDRKQN